MLVTQKILLHFQEKLYFNLELTKQRNNWQTVMHSTTQEEYRIDYIKLIVNNTRYLAPCGYIYTLNRVS